MNHIHQVTVALLSSLLIAAASAQTQPTPAIAATGTPNTYQITWPGVAGRVYFMQVSTDLQNWSYAPAVEFGTGANIAWAFSSTGQRTYMRLKYSVATNFTSGASGDFDGDGLTNLAEITTHQTDPCNPDSDADGMPDGYEQFYALNPLFNDSVWDLDGDGVVNREDARPNSNAVGRMTVTITSPGNNSNIP